MTEAIESRAFEAVSRHTRFADLVGLTRGVALRAASSRTLVWKRLGESAPESERGSLTEDDAKTDFGNVWTVLERGPTTSDERALLRALWAHALAENRTLSAAEEDALVANVVWLAAFTPFDATLLLDRALGDSPDPFWRALGERLFRLDGDAGDAAHVGSRAEAIAAAIALRTSSASAARAEATRLAKKVTDPLLSALLPVAEDAPAEIHGELASRPRHPSITALLAVTGILFVSAVIRFASRIALSYRRPAEVTLTAASVRVRSRTLILGRALRERDVVLLRPGLARAIREERYPRAAFYAGLLSLAVGSLVGVHTFIDGVRAASPSLLFVGLTIVAAGIGLDFLLATLGTGGGTCRLIFIGRDGTALSIRDVDTVAADRALLRLAEPPK